MPTDVVFAKGNEDVFLLAAKRLGYNKIVFAYNSFADLSSSILDSNVNLDGVFVKKALFVSHDNKNRVASDINRVGSIAGAEGTLVFVRARDEKFNRFVLEKTKANALVNPEYVYVKDHLHFRRSGLDQVVCKLAALNGKAILTSLHDLVFSGTEERALLMGRIMQNIAFCRKYKVNYGAVSFADKINGMRGASDVRALLFSFGMDGEQFKFFDKIF